MRSIETLILDFLHGEERINLQDLPDNIIRTFCEYLEFQEIFILKSVSKRFSKVNNYITNVKFNKQKVDSEKCKALSNAISTFNSLTELSIFDNNIGPEGCKYLSDALKMCKHLQILSVSGNLLGDDGAKLLVETLEEHKFLKKIYVYDNLIEEEEVFDKLKSNGVNVVT